jgi:hypothetical protein
MILDRIIRGLAPMFLWPLAAFAQEVMPMDTSQAAP